MFEPVPNETIENSDFKTKTFDIAGAEKDAENAAKLGNDELANSEIPKKLQQIYELFVIFKDKQSEFSKTKFVDSKPVTNIKENPFGDL